MSESSGATPADRASESDRLVDWVVAEGAAAVEQRDGTSRLVASMAALVGDRQGDSCARSSCHFKCEARRSACFALRQ